MPEARLTEESVKSKPAPPQMDSPLCSTSNRVRHNIRVRHDAIKSIQRVLGVGTDAQPVLAWIVCTLNRWFCCTLPLQRCRFNDAASTLPLQQCCDRKCWGDRRKFSPQLFGQPNHWSIEAAALDRLPQ